ncbi:MAG: DEAD/DEAH box helicase family protein [Spirochaetes bacterium]|nr:DEAD/DEAH box helicase family protein [Spirochaetota bacterium]
MKLKFKKQEFQTKAVKAVTDCFKGQPNTSSITYRIDPGIGKKIQQGQEQHLDYNIPGFRNADIIVNELALLANIQDVQRYQNIPVSSSLIKSKVSPLNLDIEMETGTGKTYCYIKTMFELNKLYGWNKFIVVVPSIAIREGVFKSFQITEDHFLEEYNKKVKVFIYNSKQLHNIESYSSDAGINVMIINVQAFNATGKDARRIYEELDDFQTRRPIDVIKANRPILIIDEPQKIEGDSKKSSKSFDSLVEFNPLMILRYSATHKKEHNKIYRLDALDAYNQKLVKQISVKGVTVKGLPGTNAYIYVDSIEVSTKSPLARIEFEVKQKTGIKRITRKVKKGDNLYVLSNELDQYKDLVVTDINANTNVVSFNHFDLAAGEATGDVNESVLRRIQIREAIKSHFQKEQALFHQGIKVLSLFFIDEVAKYRTYSESGEQTGEYAKIFEEEYVEFFKVQELPFNPDYQRYVDNIKVNKTHNGYFSIDKKTKRLIDPETGKKSDEADDTDAYDLILKDKERLLSFEEPTRFIFSHSALREGWDNPNIFVICTLKHSDNKISRRQEVGRGLRLSVNQGGERQDNPATVHQTNVLTVVASESYMDFVSGLQTDIYESLSERSRFANIEYFNEKFIKHNDEWIQIDSVMANHIYKYLVKNGYVEDDADNISDKYHEAKKEGTLAELPEDLKQYKEQIFELIDSVFTYSQLILPEDERKTRNNPLNDNFNKKEFKELWNRINKKAIYTVKFDSSELVNKCVNQLNKELRVKPMQYFIQTGIQKDNISDKDLSKNASFRLEETVTEKNNKSIQSKIRYDLVGKIAEGAKLTRRTISQILESLEKITFAQFKTNPENFISEAIRIINEQKATVIVEHLSYNLLAETYDTDIFTEAQKNISFSNAGNPLKHHVYDYAITDSKNERTFVEELDTCAEVIVYAKLPRGFFIPTPVGEYNPDWAIAFKEGSVKHIYFVAETKGSMSSLELRGMEESKINCARKFFDEINLKMKPEHVKYDVIDGYDKLMEVVRV